jgi:hypothetical protein
MSALSLTHFSARDEVRRRVLPVPAVAGSRLSAGLRRRHPAPFTHHSLDHRVGPPLPPPPPLCSLPGKASCAHRPCPLHHLSRPEPSFSLLRVNAISKLHRRRAGPSHLEPCHPSSSTTSRLGGASSVLAAPSSTTSALEPPFCHGHL